MYFTINKVCFVFSILLVKSLYLHLKRKEEIWLGPMKNRKTQKATRQLTNATKNFDYGPTKDGQLE